MGSITHVSWVRPSHLLGGIGTTGPDEDEFTLGARALEIVLGDGLPSETPSRLRRVHLVGRFPPVAEWGFSELVGNEGLEVLRHPLGWEGLWEGFDAAANETGEDRWSAVIAADLAARSDGVSPSDAPKWGAVGAAVLLSENPGLIPLGSAHTDRSPLSPGMRGAGSVGISKILGAPSDSGPSTVLELAEEPGTLPPTAGAPEAVVPESSEHIPQLGLPPSASALWFLRNLDRRLGARRHGALLSAERDAWLVLGVRKEGSVRWLGDWERRSLPPISIDSAHAALAGSIPVNNVSEGAYVPRPRYLENLPSRWRFEADRCRVCRGVTFPVATSCRHCGKSEGLDRMRLPQDHLRVLAKTVVRPGGQPTEFDAQVAIEGSYAAVIAELRPEIRVTLQVTDIDPEIIRIGGFIDTRLRRLYPMEGEWRYGRKAVPAAVEDAERIRDTAASVPSPRRPRSKATGRSKARS